MSGFFQRFKNSSSVSNLNGSAKGKKDKEDPAPDLSPLERLLHNAGPVRDDGIDKFYGLENFGNTCYCNSIIQALYFSEPFRQNVLKYPKRLPSTPLMGDAPPIRVVTTPRSPIINGYGPRGPNHVQLTTSASSIMRPRPALVTGSNMIIQPLRPDEKPDTPEYKKKQAMIKGPVLNLTQDNSRLYGMEESTFTGLKDIFTAVVQSKSRTGVLSLQRFLEIFKRDNEMFRNSMHQDAHEFYGLVLNDVITSVEAHERYLQQQQPDQTGSKMSGTSWVREIFEGVLTSETKCLTCETASQRDETFLDLSIDLEEHSSVTSCLRKFSAEEMLCERNKFHCDHCGGLQEAEKRMKIKRLPRILALHLKRFKYTEDYSRLQKLFHRVVYPFHLRMLNTTNEANDPYRLYELYAVVIHIGGNAYHGHYVVVIKTQGRGWLLFDDELVEPVDQDYVWNFFGDKPGMACAYVLFYQETTHEKVRAEWTSDGPSELAVASERTMEVLAQMSSSDTPRLARPSNLTKPPVSEMNHTALANHNPPKATLDAMATRSDPEANGIFTLSPFAEAIVDSDPPLTADSSDLGRKGRHKLIEDEQTQQQDRQKQANEHRGFGIENHLHPASVKTLSTEVSETDGLLVSYAATAGEKSGNFLQRTLTNRGGKLISRKSFGFLNKDRPKPEELRQALPSSQSLPPIPPTPPVPSLPTPPPRPPQTSTSPHPSSLPVRSPRPTAQQTLPQMNGGYFTAPSPPPTSTSKSSSKQEKSEKNSFKQRLSFGLIRRKSKPAEF